jgi:glutamine---fructose-6-phosphate transaminase (isomerizing)
MVMTVNTITSFFLCFIKYYLKYMCGIISFIGNEDSFNVCLNGLKQLQNRGYDSAGICSMGKEFINSKYASSNESALVKLGQESDKHRNVHLSIGHTRWATHGAKTDANSHPHISTDGLFSLVHNGIIENYADLKEMLIAEGYHFSSQTDTEVVVNLISFHYRTSNSVESAIEKAVKSMEGTWGLAIMCKDEPHKIYATRHGSPILVSANENMAMITSEQSGFCNMASNYIVLENYDICVLEKCGEKVSMVTRNDYAPKTITQGEISLTPDPYPHWTIKEIHEQYESSLRAISHGGRLMPDGEVKLDGLNENLDKLLMLDNIILLGCGTSYHAGMFGVNYLKEIGGFNCVQLFDGAEFNERDIPKEGKTGLILLSQSGETKDLHRCIQIGRDYGLFLIGVVNVKDSLIAREVDCGCYLNAGREVAVASTKAYTSQIIILNMIALWFAQKRGINSKKCENYIRDLRNLHKDIKKTIEMCEKSIDDLLPLFEHHSCFLLGKGQSESIAREGALKIKEISYIHAEGYSTSSLKHGPFALLCEKFPVVLIAPNNEHYAKNENAYEEIRSRHATIIYISDKEVDKENTLKIENNENFRDFLSIIPLQLLAYKLSLSRGLNPDMPRNLAKVVTVE